MPQKETVAVTGVFGSQGILKASREADRALRRELGQTLKPVGEAVRSEATIRFSPIDARSARGYRTRVRQTGIIVEQSLRRTTGKHPQYGKLQMQRALLPAQRDKEPETMRLLEQKVNEVCDRWENR